MNVFETLKERGFVQQTTDEDTIRTMLGKDKVTCYIGFDPTASSMHVGNLLPIMALMHMQQHGHHVLVIIGGGTGLIGDPSGKTELRSLLEDQQLQENLFSIKKQFTQYLSFETNQGRILNNADWIVPLNYVEFLRDIGSQFSVNRMLTADCFKQRMERGLSFIEFNYMLLQAYDFLVLNKNYGCNLQMGGDDQWSNILAGIDLIRRKNRTEAFGLTLPLITTADGKKMGKTEKGAVWLDGSKTSPYEYYQFWRNVDDRDVNKLLALYTMLPMDEINRLRLLKDKEINEAKEILAYEATKITHGKEEADKSREAAKSLFGKGDSGEDSSIPTTEMTESQLKAGIPIVDILIQIGLTSSKGESRRMIQQGGIYMNGERVDDLDLVITDRFIQNEIIAFRKGKKIFHHIKIL